MLCIVSRRRDPSTHVYGYIDVDVLDGTYGQPVDEDDWLDVVGPEVAEECREQHPSPDHIRAAWLEEVAEMLRQRGHDVEVRD